MAAIHSGITYKETQKLISESEEMIAYREEIIKGKKEMYDTMSKEWEKLENEKDRLTNSYREKSATYMVAAKKESLKLEFEINRKKICSRQETLVPTLRQLKDFLMPHEDAIERLKRGIEDLKAILESCLESLEFEKEWRVARNQIYAPSREVFYD